MHHRLLNMFIQTAYRLNPLIQLKLINSFEISQTKFVFNISKGCLVAKHRVSFHARVMLQFFLDPGVHV